MVIALFALSLVMIVGGVAAVVQGFPYVRLESGLAMVIGGTTAASAGVVLLGLGAAVMQLKRVERILGRRSPPGDLPDRPVPSDPPLMNQSMAALPPVPTAPPSSGAGAAGLAGLAIGGTVEEVGRPRFDGPAEHEPTLPDLLPPETPTGGIADDDLFVGRGDEPGRLANLATLPRRDTLAEPGTVGDDAQVEFALRPSLHETAEARPSDPLVSTVTAPEPPVETPRQAVGSYASGGNTYVMYSDGTIDAETPRGRFTFQSLDELKEFVASGEAGERGAA